MNSRMAKYIALGPLILATLAACSRLTAPLSDPLDGTSWTLETYGAAKPIPGTTITLAFENGTAHGSSGCNSYSGNYTLRGSRIEIGSLVSTLMACLGPEGVMDQEQAFLGFLGDARSYEIVDGRLQILRSDGEALRFLAQD